MSKNYCPIKAAIKSKKFREKLKEQGGEKWERHKQLANARAVKSNAKKPKIGRVKKEPIPKAVFRLPE